MAMRTVAQCVGATTPRVASRITLGKGDWDSRAFRALDLLGNAWYNRSELVCESVSTPGLTPMPQKKKSANPLTRLGEKQIEQLRQVEERLHRVVQERRAATTRPAVHAEHTFGSITLRYETVRCGKANCTRCPHGPYWYAYWKENGRTRSRYIGRVLPEKARQVYEAKQRAKLERKT